MPKYCACLLVALLILPVGCSLNYPVAMPEPLLEDVVASVPLLFPGIPQASHSLELADRPDESYRAWIRWLKEDLLPASVTPLEVSSTERDFLDYASRHWLPWLQQQSDQGDISSQIMLAMLLLQNLVPGKKRGQEWSEGLLWLDRAAASGNGFAAWHRALLMLDTTAGVDAVRLDKLLHQAARTGNALVFLSLARLYRDGDRLVQNREQAVEWFLKLEQDARDQHLSNEARVNLGLMVWFGIGIKQDRTEAEKKWKMAAANGSGPAAYLAALATGYTAENNKQTLLKQAVTAQVIEGFNQQGLLFWNKGNYIQAAARFDLGHQAGDDLATYNMGLTYYTGKGRTPDPHKALVMFSEAAARGNRHALRLQGFLLWQGSGQVTASYSKARDIFMRAASMGDLYSYYALGIMAAIGQGEPRDLVTAWSHLALVAAWGVSEAATLRDIVVEKMTEQQKSVARKQAQVLFDNCRNMSVYLDIERQSSTIRGALVKPKS